MLEDCRNKKIDYIITKSVSRFGRNTVDCLNAIRELKTLGIDVFFEKEDIHSLQNTGELLLTLLMAVAEAEIYSISENVRWGMIKRIEQGQTTLFKNPPYGYLRGTDEFIINESEAIVVRRIYQEFLNGNTYTDIAERLTQDGIPTCKGLKQWDTVVVMQILNNESYRGDLCYQKSFVVDPISKKRKTNNGILPQYYLSNIHPWLIEPSFWDCIQLEKKRRALYRNTYHTALTLNTIGAPFVGKIICSFCNYSFAKRSNSTYLFCTGYGKLKGSDEREKLTCHHIKLNPIAPDKAFISAWNRLVERYESYVPVWEDIIQNSTDALLRYRAADMLGLVKETGRIARVDYRLVFRTLDHMEVGVDGGLEVVFLCKI